MITDAQTLYGASSRGSALRVWDDGFGPLWLYAETFGPVGIVRSQTWEDAFEAVIDEIMADAEEGTKPDEEGNLPEGCHFRANGIPANDGLNSAIAEEDLNGSYLIRLTPDVGERWGITLETEEANV